jgi:alkylation response protein AidB-like acyl-CoA dehydrogenase
LEFVDIEVKPGQMLDPVSPAGFLKRHMLGLSAVAVGNARGALDTAKAYAAERYQGCAQIDEHAAVRILIGESASRIHMCCALLEQIALGETVTMAQAFASKLRITLECSQAVTDCLQVLGGYGYMEDYRQEKRLRDALTLKSMVIKPDLLRMLCAPADMGGDG